MITKNWMISLVIVSFMFLGTVTVAAVNLDPVADAGGPYSGTIGGSIPFDASGSLDPDGTIVQYDWKWADTGAWFNDLGATPSHTYNPAGAHTYTVTVRVTDDAGATDTDTATVAVSQDTIPPPAPIISSPTHPYQYPYPFDVYCSPYAKFTWAVPPDASGIKCYSYCLSHYLSTKLPDKDCDTFGTSAHFHYLQSGTWYFHVRAQDNAGNWGPSNHFKINIEDCDNKDGWYYTTEYRWIDDPINPCQEKEQRKQDYRDYYCPYSYGYYYWYEETCQYTVTNTTWIDTGRLRDKPDGTKCDYGPWENDPENVCRERRIVYHCQNGSCQHDIYSYEYRHKINGTGCGEDFYDDWVYYCVGDTIRGHQLFHDFFCDDGECRDHTSWRNDEFVADCSVSDGWYQTGVTRWVNDSGNPCCEIQQREEVFRDYTCSNGRCGGYNVTGIRYNDTGQVQMKPDGTVCGYGPWETDPNNVCRERRQVFLCQNGTCEEYYYEYQNKTCLCITPQIQTYTMDDQFTINITITPHTPLAGAQFNLHFNPSHLTINTIKEGNLFNQKNAETFFTYDTLDNTQGLLEGVACVITTPGQSVTQPGVLATITGRITCTDVITNLTLSNVIVGDPHGISLPVGIHNGTIILKNNTPPDVPATPTGPTHGLPATPYTYGSCATDPDGDPIQYQFHWGDTLDTWTSNYSSGTTCTQNHTWAIPGTYTVKIKAKDQQGEETPWSPSLTVHIKALSQKHPPVATLSANRTQGLSPLNIRFQLDASDPDGSINTWTLDINNDGTHEHSGSGKPPTVINHLYESPGTYTARLSLTDMDGATDTDYLTITVAPPPNLTLTARFNYIPQTAIHINEPVMFYDTSNDTDGLIVNWTWEITSQNFSDHRYGENISFTFPYPFNYTVTLQVEDDKGNRDTYSVNLQTLLDDTTSENTPGFELLPLLLSFLSLLFLTQRKRKHGDT